MPAAPNPPTPSPTGAGDSPPRRIGLARRGLWAVADQGLFAGANFLITVVLAGWLSEHDFGAFTTAYASFLIIGVFVTALVAEPMMVFGSKKFRDDLPAYLGRMVGGHLLITAVGGVVLGPIGGAVWFRGEPELGLALGCLAMTQVSQILPWITRNACYIEGSPRHAAYSGVIYLVLILGIMAVLNQLGHLGLVTAIFTMGFASLVTNIYLLIQLRVDLRAVFRRNGYGPVARDHWRYGKWALPTGLTRYIPEQLPFIAVPFVLGWAAGGSWGSPDLERGGALKALMNFAVPLVLVGWAIATPVLPMLVRARGTRQFAKVSGAMLMVTAGLPLLCWPLLGVFAEPLIDLVYRGKYVEYAGLLWIIGLIPVIAGVDSVLHAQLKAAERPDRLFVASVASSIVLIVVGFPLLLWGGLQGAVTAILISYAAQAVTLLIAGGRIIKQQTRPLDEKQSPDNAAASAASMEPHQSYTATALDLPERIDSNPAVAAPQDSR